MGKKLPDVESLDQDCRPKTGDSDKFFCGDRFHDKNVIPCCIEYIITTESTEIETIIVHSIFIFFWLLRKSFLKKKRKKTK